MNLQSIKLSNFKNYRQQTVSLSARLNCFVGLNGMGKTNLLDAVYMLCLTRSHRNLPDKNLIRHGEAFFRLEGQFQHEKVKNKIAIKYAAGQRKVVEENGSAYERLADYIGRYPVVMIAPDDISLVQEGSEERRRFLDTTLSQIYPEYLQNLLLYNNLLKQRNALLKLFAEHRRFDPTLLEALDRQLPGPAHAVVEKRRAFAAQFVPLFQEFYSAIAGSEELVSVELESGIGDRDFATVLLENRDKDRALERTAAGPHRDDLRLSLHGQPIKKYASQGQLKSFLLALRLAQYALLRREKGLAPLLLLDDIFAKLDEQRVQQLMNLLIEREFGQIFITDTQRSRIESVVTAFPGKYRIFEVKNGELVMSDE
ncbi:MAG: DNA replication/repair protein RecF [Lewinellaceae bacterium]|nr:DNA replication/repair protein RecF [Lewinellaceae bacterium]